ncbi:hypothetical protein [Ktedonobacter sp. SOSP1-85]|uniref:hypothetical protein n=1 Tax=Ktedonobacter sp. SOSP1-85 TaxID=2778367 RepID=UPI0019158159|nr:hypothetical protein [Ktedonobacter sp. SOSP1-85]
MHLTESCEAHLPLLITHVETTSAPVSDDAMTATIHAELDRKHLLPTEHIVDTGYVDAKLLVESQRDYQVDLLFTVGMIRSFHNPDGPCQYGGLTRALHCGLSRSRVRRAFCRGRSR